MLNPPQSPFRGEDNRDFLSTKSDVDKITFENEEDDQEDESLLFIEGIENRNDIDEDKNPPLTGGGRGGLNPTNQRSRGSYDKYPRAYKSTQTLPA